MLVSIVFRLELELSPIWGVQALCCLPTSPCLPSSWIWPNCFKLLTQPDWCVSEYQRSHTFLMGSYLQWKVTLAGSVSVCQMLQPLALCIQWQNLPDNLPFCQTQIFQICLQSATICTCLQWSAANREWSARVCTVMDTHTCVCTAENS